MEKLIIQLLKRPIVWKMGLFLVVIFFGEAAIKMLLDMSPKHELVSLPIKLGVAFLFSLFPGPVFKRVILPGVVLLFTAAVFSDLMTGHFIRGVKLHLSHAQAGFYSLVASGVFLSVFFALKRYLFKWTRPFYYLTMEQIDRLGDGNSKVGGTLFEEYLVKLYRQLGYTAHTIAELKKKGLIKIKSVDQGADIHIEYHESGQIIKAVIQCKHYSKTVGNDAVQEVHSARSFYDADVAIVVTNNYFTPQAKELANKLEVHMVDRNQLNIINERAARPKMNQMLENIKAKAA